MEHMSLKDFFADAPYFRAHEGSIGAKYNIKPADSPLMPGLWFPQTPERMEIATHNPKPDAREFTDNPTYDEARAQYDFETINVQAGDAVVDYHLYFQGSRDGYDFEDRSAESTERMLRAERDNNALIRFHIPRDVFFENYELDDVRKLYREKPYRKMLANEDTMVEWGEGKNKLVRTFQEAVLRKGEFFVRDMEIFPGADQRLICDMPLDFYLKELDEKRGTSTMWMQHGDEGFGISLSARPGKAARNPYGFFQGLYAAAATEFDKEEKFLSAEQRKGFDNHHRDVRMRYEYFQQNPVIL